jgi:hypothetical protein
MTDPVKQIREWQELVKENKPTEPEITQIRISKVMPMSGKLFLVGAHAYISEGDYQEMVGQRTSEEVSEFAQLAGIPILREWPPEEFCPNCWWNEFYVKNRSINFGDGDLCCKKCDHKLRDWDSG